MPRSRVESSGISSCVGADGLVLGSGIGLLLSSDTVAGAASTQTASPQKVIEISKRRDGCARHPDLHGGTSRGIEHPFGHNRENARQHLNVHEPAGLAAINPLDPDAPPKQRMPAVMDNRILPDMGRMDG
jgi:hypothetical protein